MSDIKRILVLPKIKIHNANALSSPYTVGFPAMTAWLGGVHALERKLVERGVNGLKFHATGVICHEFELQTYQGVGDYVQSIVITGNPLMKDGKRSAFIEEARCHLTVTLIFEYTGVDKSAEQDMLTQIERILGASMKFAGGDILSFSTPNCIKGEDGNEQDIKQLTRKIMPCYALIERRELVAEAMTDGQDALDAIIEYLAVHHRCSQEEGGDVVWTSERQTSGWIVPVATGFQGLTPLEPAKNQRDEHTEHRFAESVVTLGEFKMPHKLKSVNEILWHYVADIENDLYLCQQ